MAGVQFKFALNITDKLHLEQDTEALEAASAWCAGV